MNMNASTVWAAIAAVAATASAALTAAYTWLTLRLLRSQGEPNIGIYVRHDQSRPTLLELVIKNIGRGPATDLSFRSSRPIPYRAFGITLAQAKPAQPMTSGPFINGILLLAPDESRVVTWGQLGGLKKALGPEPINVTCVYWYRGRRMPAVYATLEVDSYDATDASDTETRQAIKTLGDIRASVDRLRNSIERLATTPESDEDDDETESASESA